MGVGDADLATVYNDRRRSRFEGIDRAKDRAVGDGLPPADGARLNRRAGDEVRHVLFTSGAGSVSAWIAATLFDRVAGHRIRASVAGESSDAVLGEAARVMQAFDSPTAVVPAHLTLGWDGAPDLVVVIGADARGDSRLRTWLLPDVSEEASFALLAAHVRALAVDLSVNPSCRAATR